MRLLLSSLFYIRYVQMNFFLAPFYFFNIVMLQLWKRPEELDEILLFIYNIIN